MTATEQLEHAILGVRSEPFSEEKWQALEELGADNESPEEVIAVYDELVGAGVDADLVSFLAKRAWNFHQQWSGTDVSVIERILTQSIDKDPENLWGHERLIQLYTNRQEWNKLLDAYAAVIKVADESQKAGFLEEAAEVARDVASEPDRAIGFLQDLFVLRPGDTKVQSALERLYERGEKWVELIELWEKQLATKDGEERAPLLLKIGQAWLSNMSRPSKVIAPAQELLDLNPGDPNALDLMRSVLVSEGTDHVTKRTALGHVRTSLLATDPRQFLSILEATIEHSEGDFVVDLRQELAERLVDLDDNKSALKHYAMLLAQNPDDHHVFDKLRQIAIRADAQEDFAISLIEAAKNASGERRVYLNLEAARVYVESLADEDKAIEVYEAVLAEDHLKPRDERLVAMRLNELYISQDNAEKRLPVLKRLASVETSDSSRRAILGELARLAESLDDQEQAVQFWNERLRLDEGDLWALNALIDLLSAKEDWEQLVEALSNRVKKDVTQAQRHSDLVWIARIYSDKIEDTESAISSWYRVQTECGIDTETIGSLVTLLSAAERWSELAELLEQHSYKDAAMVTSRLVQLADAQRLHLNAPEKAFDAYVMTLAIDPKNESSIEGLEALVNTEACAEFAIEALMTAHKRTRNWKSYIELVDPAVDHSADTLEKLDLLITAGSICMEDLEDVERALHFFSKAMPLAPQDRALERRVVSLARRVDKCKAAADALISAAEATQEPRREAELRFAIGSLAENDLSDASLAFISYVRAIEIDPERVEAVVGAVRTGAEMERWEELAVVVESCASTLGRLPDLVIEEVNQLPEDKAVGQVAAVVLNQVDDNTDTRVAFEIMFATSGWFSRSGNLVRAIQVLEQACALCPREIEARRNLVSLQRRAEHPDLAKNLLKLAILDNDNVQMQMQAITVAQEAGDSETIRQAGKSLAKQIGQLQRIEGASQEYADLLDKVTETVVKDLADAGQFEDVTSFWVEAARHHVDDDRRVAALRHAADNARAHEEDLNRATDLLREVLEINPLDEEATTALCDVYEKSQRFHELFTIRRNALTRQEDPEKRIKLRLEISKIGTLLETKGDQVSLLEENLQEKPGHIASIVALAEVFMHRGQYEALADTLEREADVLLRDDRADAAARLWAQAAELAQEDVKDEARAIRCLRAAINAQASTETLSKLAELYLTIGTPRQAIPWFENLLGSVEASERPEVAVKLAKAHLAVDDEVAAIEALRQEVASGNADDKVIVLLADLYRKRGQSESLAELLASSLSIVSDLDANDFAREAATIFCEQIDRPARALEALEKALENDPNDSRLRFQYVRALRASGNLSDAREQIDTQLEKYGRRRSPERALLHLERARVLEKEGRADEALEDLQSAASMDPASIDIQIALAKLARSIGNVSLSEKTYRGLLVKIRRSNEVSENVPAASEILYELASLAKEGGDDAKYKDLIESAYDSATSDSNDLMKYARRLLQHEDTERLRDIYRQRIEVLEDARDKTKLYIDLASIVANHLEKHGEALDILLEAIECTPDDEQVHEEARSLSVRCGRVGEFVRKAVSSVGRLQRKEDPPVIAKLLMNAGEALEKQDSDPRGALAIYQQVAETGELMVEATFAVARVAAMCGADTEREQAVSSLLAVSRGRVEGVDDKTMIDAGYRLAHILISESDTSRGVELLRECFQREPRYRQAGEVLGVLLAKSDTVDESALTMYEEVSRKSSDPQMLLDCLERKYAAGLARPAEVREAVSIAKSVQEFERAANILVSVMDAADEPQDWAIRDLVQCRIEMDKYQETLAVVSEVSEEMFDDELFEMVMRAGTRAVEHREESAAIGLFEIAYQHRPTSRSAWQPLVGLYVDAGNLDGLAHVVEKSMSSIGEVQERNELRLAYATALSRDDLRAYEAVGVMREALSENPAYEEGASLIEQVLKSQGRTDEIVEFAEERFQLVVDNGQAEGVAASTMRLMDIIPPEDSERRERIFRQALTVVPEDPVVLKGLLCEIDESRADDQAEVIDRLIPVVDSAAAGKFAIQLADIYKAQEKSQEEVIALKRGFSANRTSPVIRQRLEQSYHDTGDWAGLAEMKERMAAIESESEPVPYLLEAAELYRDKLQDATSALRCVQTAWQMKPQDHKLLLEFVSAQRACGMSSDAIEHLTNALDNYIEGPNRVPVLLVRSECLAEGGDLVAAVNDCQAAFSIDQEASVDAFAAVLDRTISKAQSEENLDEERDVTLKKVSMLRDVGRGEDAKLMLITWSDRDPSDIAVLQELRNMHKSKEEWAGVVRVCDKLIVVQEGEEQIASALEMASAAEKAQIPEQAIAGLEKVFAAQPESDDIRLRLKQIYEAAEDYEKLANILCSDAEHAGKERDAFLNYKRAAEIFYRKLGDSTSAISAAVKARNIVEDDHDVTVLLADTYIQEGRLDEAFDMLDAAILTHKRRSPALGMLQQRMARVSAARGDRENQLVWLKKAFDVDRRSGEIAAELAQLATESGDYDLALKPLRAITLMENPGPITRTMALLWEAKIEQARGNQSKALLWARKALREDPEFHEAQEFIEQIQN